MIVAIYQDVGFVGSAAQFNYLVVDTTGQPVEQHPVPGAYTQIICELVRDVVRLNKNSAGPTREVAGSTGVTVCKRKNARVVVHTDKDVTTGLSYVSANKEGVALSDFKTDIKIRVWVGEPATGI